MFLGMENKQNQIALARLVAERDMLRRALVALYKACHGTPPVYRIAPSDTALAAAATALRAVK